MSNPSVYASQQFLALAPQLPALPRCSPLILFTGISLWCRQERVRRWHGTAAPPCKDHASQLWIAAQVLAFSPPADTLREVGGADEQGEQVAGAISEGDLGGRHGG